ncbi:hypothetical protein A176_001902 [Myxococcus hansupus]|uniref:Uncharacterized protein n=1 Tax=Pseudomyxococcus hansupus TaxID=1297742 RepID=A0A0H4WUM4_9BACT|nr:hypothetical protein [Myxococcus hansupus]AKQ64990.1 hypothetical protein A176_001902 [Myxococcus hansupus]
MVTKGAKQPKRDGAVVSINPHDPPPEPTPGLTGPPPYSSKMSVTLPVNTPMTPGGSDETP